MSLPNTWINRFLALLLLGYAGFLGVRALLPKESLPETVAQDEGAISVYFTHPGGAASVSLQGGPDARLASAIDRAVDSVDMAAYDINLWSIRDALIRAHRRGVAVRLVMESSNIDRLEVRELIDAGIQVRGDERQHLMHHKFAVIDQAEVWTGSMNFTVNGAYRNNNNLIQINSPAVASLYSDEFAEMFVLDQFGRLSSPDEPHDAIRLDEVQLEVLFSPDQVVSGRITQLIAEARESVYVLAFNLTLDSIAEALIEAQGRGVQVRGVFESSQADNQGSDVERLANAGVDVVHDGNSRKMHHKAIIIDRRIVITGSYNFSRSAEEQNDENLLILFSPELAEQYLIEFTRLRAEGAR